MEIDFEKHGGLVPVVVQDVKTRVVLMVAFMNKEALQTTLDSGKVTFFSRTKGRLWTKGESSGHFLMLKEIIQDCDNDSLLIKAEPIGPTCHTGADTCFNESNNDSIAFIRSLSKTIKDRKIQPNDTSYTASLFKRGINKVAQKVGEEAIELVIEAKDNNKELFLGEAADLLYHYLVLLEAKDYSLEEVVKVLESRNKK
ncbi:MAG: bifunctional phosphoribosyl-AMP cyclohydrolase/phosphoribosyl-ATP diphosphatase HisIE [Opitutaceae bacterium]|nr:bifunctional phosphoribosyl-AMP cyclohydrolase/phosphoribosyl-ATP diphosphatase HisIE [Cytophagales bacterium]